MFGSVSPMSRLGMPQANSTISMPRLHLGPGLGERLAVLARHQRGQFLEVRVQQLAEAEHDAGPLDGRRLAPGRQRGRGRLDDRGRFARPSQNGTRAITWPVEGLKTSPLRADSDRCHWPPREDGNACRLWLDGGGHEWVILQCLASANSRVRR